MQATLGEWLGAAALWAGQAAVPFGLALWFAAAPPASRAGLFALAALSGLWLWMAGRAGIWLFPPLGLWWATCALWGFGALRAARRLFRRPGPAWPRGRAGRRALWPAVALSAALAAVVADLETSALPPEPAPVSIARPLTGARVLAVHGGAHDWLNGHRRTLQPDHPWRGQSHAVDLVGLDRWGRRAPGVQPADPRAYVIHGAEVVAPCAGEVISARADAPDQVPPRMDLEDRLGNHVLLACDGFDLLLAHLAPGTVSVAEGERVALGAPLGRVGNSGASSEPHLHVHAQRGDRARSPADAEPVPLLIEGEALLRNAVRDWR